MSRRGVNLAPGGKARTIRNVEVMQAVIENEANGGFRSLEEVAEMLDVHKTLPGKARYVLREQPDLVSEVLDESLTIYRAYEIATKGDRIDCPMCHGRGHVFRRRAKTS